ncbi:MAG: T9SS type A sorting domain-containing protein [Ignavibacteriales bacterium]|nr:T9SS type A sorting domain-containing protein [Ignavibacteriales bacterium]
MKRLLTFLLFAGVAMSAFAQSPYEYLSPLPGSKYHNPEATIIVRHGDFINPATVSADAFVVTGSESGVASGEAILSTDRKTVIFKPSDVFRFGETVTVEILGGVETLDGEAPAPFMFEFEVREELGDVDFEALNADLTFGEPTRPYGGEFTPSVEDSMPVPIVDTVNNPSPGALLYANRNVLNPPDGYWSWAMIFNSQGEILKRRKVNTSFGELQLQDNGMLSRGIPVQYPGFFGGYYCAWELMDTSLTPVDTLWMGNGYIADIHDFRLLPNGHSLMHTYVRDVIDMSDSIPGGLPNAVVIWDIVQELDADQNVVFQWRSQDHLPVVGVNAEYMRPGFAHLHINSLEVDHDGHLLISARQTNGILKVDRNTGELKWIMGGYLNDWTFVGDHDEYAPHYIQWQHDLRVLPNGNYTLFDNGNANLRDWARGVEYEIDETTMTATLVWEYAHPDSFLAPSMGSCQRLPNGNTLIGWGSAPVVFGAPALTEVTPGNEIVLQMRFEGQLNTYRIKKHPIYAGQPVASVMEEVLQGDDYEFETVNDTVGIRVTTNALPTGGGYIFVTGTREDYGPVNPDFLGESPLVDKHRLFIEVSPSGSVDFDVAIKLDWFKNVRHSDSAVVYMRETPGEGVFTPLATTHNTIDNTLEFNTTTLGEFIVGRPDPETTIYGPQLVMPKNGADVNAENDVRLEWTPIGRVNNQYTVQVSTTTDFTSPLYEANVQGTIDSVSGLTNDVEYFWRVQAENAAGVAWSDTFSFTPTAPYVRLVTPNGGEDIGVDTAYFYIEWEDNLDHLMHITLWKDGAFYAEIDSSVESPDNKYTWEPDNSIPSGSYVVRVESAEDPLLFDVSDGTFTNVDERSDLPTAYSLAQNYPNPFNPTTTIEFTLPEATTARVAIYDMLGREVAVLADGRMTAGVHRVEFDASALASGVYFYRLEAGAFNAVRKMALMK